MSQKPVTQYPPPPNQPDFYHQYRKEDITNNSLYDLNFQPNPSRIYKNRSALVVDSRDRDSGSADCYEYTIPDLYYDVVSVELKLADIPNSVYLVNNTNNQFYFQDTREQVYGGEFYQVTVPVGNYFATSEKSVSIQALLEAGLNEASQSSTYEVTVSRHTNKFTITQTSGSGFFNVFFISPEKEHKKNKPDKNIEFYEPFRKIREKVCPEKPCPSNKGEFKFDPCGTCPETDFDFGHRSTSLIPCVIENTMEILLGFSKRNFSVGCSEEGQPTLTSDQTYNLKQDKYVVLRIESDGREWRRINSKNSDLKNAYAVLPFDFNLNNFQFLSNLDRINNEILIVDFKEPVKVGKLKVKFTTRDGRPIDFNGHDHLLVFEVTSLSRVDNYHE